MTHEAVEQRLARLAPDQRAAATAPRGPVLCIAPAGSGKTTTLVARIAWLVDSGVDPATLAAITFNKRAAVELDQRLTEALAPLDVPSGAVRVRTFHALGREILADAGVDVSRLVDRAAILAEVAGRPVGAAELRRLDDGFSRLRLDPDAAGQAEPAMIEAYRRYRAALTERDALDFDDLVARAFESLRDDATLRDRWQARCASLLVDEVQDVDRTQLELALLLCQPERDVFLVGDDDQTIYAWRLADVRRILGLAGALPGLRRVDLETNYRCPAPVVRRSVRLIEHSVERFAKRIVPSPKADGHLILAADPGDATARARRLLTTWYGREDGTHAVLARTNAELAPFAAVALERQIPYQATDDGLLLDHPGLDRVLVGAGRSANEPGTAGRSWLVALSRSVGGIRGEDAWVVRSVLAWAAAFPSFSAFHDAVAEARRRRVELRRDDARLALATVHSTKGLEFDHACVVGLDEGTFPSERSLADAPDRARALEEERRLAYVAWTRARRSLLLVYDPGVPSPFMLEAFDPAELAA